MGEIRNILIADYQACTADARGGTEIASYRIAEALTGMGYALFNVFWHGQSPSLTRPYQKVTRLDSGDNFTADLSAFLSENQIDLMIFMGSLKWVASIRKAVDDSGRNLKFLLMLHYTPGRETKEFRRKLLSEMIWLKPSKIDNYLNFLIAPFLRVLKGVWLSKRYRKAISNTDGIILLSESYIPVFMKIARTGNSAHFMAIPNIYDSNAGESAPTSDMPEKEKRVLVLSRLDEKQKRISHILRIWQMIEKKPDLSDWQLDIVGDGRYRQSYEKIVSRLRLRNVRFYGWQDSSVFLNRSSIIAMTSLYEGLSLSLIEAMSKGCVPVIYGSYSAAYDVVENGVDGFIIPGFGDTNAFAAKLSLLMEDGNLRQRMALKAMEKARTSFNVDTIGRKWKEINLRFQEF